MRILHLANHARDVGNGIVNVMVDLAVAQAAAGHAVTIASAECGFGELLAGSGVRHVTLAQRKPLALPLAVRELRRLTRETTPDIVHAHMVSGALVGALARRAGGGHYALVTTVHNEFQRSSDLMRLGDRVVAVSGAVAASMIGRGIPADKIRVVRNGTIGSARLARLPAARKTLAGPSIVTVSGLYARKGVLDLIDAFADVHRAVPGAQLYLVGNGPDRAACVQLAEDLGVSDAVHLPGFARDPRPWMRAADVFVLASHSESFPLVLSEAREAGCAIVATAVGGVPEALGYGAAGLIVPAQRPRLLGEALSRLLRDRDTLDGWRARAAQDIDWLRVDRVERDYGAIYTELLAEQLAGARPPQHVPHAPLPVAGVTEPAKELARHG
jgi:glycosyltransferase involved in cell wall biosynthesis